MIVKKLVIVVIVAFLLFFLIAEPTQAATVTGNILGWLKTGAEGIVTFVKNLFD